jgi:hypothetical protein
MPERSADGNPMSIDVTLVPIPAGMTADGRLRVLLTVSPRLIGANTLGGFPVFVDWTTRLQTQPVQLSLNFGGTLLPAAVQTADIQPDMWSALFRESTPVESFVPDDFRRRAVISYRTRDALSVIRELYQQTTVSHPGGLPPSQITARTLSPIGLTEVEPGQLSGRLQDLRRGLFFQQQDQPGQVGALPSPASPFDTAEAFTLYHRMPAPGPDAPSPLPATPAALAAIVDFHKALTALASYPLLQRLLGLVLEVLLPADAVKPAGESGLPFATVAVEAFAPGGGWGEPVRLLNPAVLYRYHPAASGSVAIFAATDDGPADLAQGFLRLDEGRFHLLDLDVDGSMAKLTHLASMMPRAIDSPTADGALPALRSGGLMLAMHDRGSETVAALVRAASIEGGMQGEPGAAPPVLRARDLLRGYRVDIWSSATQRWYSLHRRLATYTFGDGGPTVGPSEEEGFVQFTTASPAPDPTRTPPADGTPPVETDLYVHERLARWSGWSLSAPKPGRPLNRSADPHHPLADDPTADAFATAFHLRTRFAVAPGSLPRLRFGHFYRTRVRAVDIAGHGPLFDPGELGPLAEAGFPVALPPAPAGTPYLRYEPVPHPILVLRTAPPERRPAIDRLVIRSFNSDPSLDVVATTETDERHVAPPRAAVELAELHGMFDEPSGQVRGDPATFATLVARNDAAFHTVAIGAPPTNTPVEPAERLDVDYLPDPIARAAALRFLPGVRPGELLRAGVAGLVADPPDPEEAAGPVLTVSFGQSWPRREAFRLQLSDGTTAPDWNATGRVLTARLPKAGVALVEISSSINQADLALLGVWAWQRAFLEELTSAAIAAGGDTLASTLEDQARLAATLTRLALEGGQWALTPPVPVRLVHAVQQPLGHPAFTCATEAQFSQFVGMGGFFPSGAADPRAPLAAWRRLGSPDAVLVGGLATHYASTARVDIQASWTDIIDDAPDGARFEQHTGVVEPILLGGSGTGTGPRRRSR